MQRGNVFLKGKSEAFGGFADLLGEEMENAGVGKAEGEVEADTVKKEAVENGEGIAEGKGEAVKGGGET